MMSSISGSQSSRPAVAPVNIDTGAFNLADAAQFGASLVAALAVAAVGAFITWSVIPTYYDLSGWRFILGSFGVLLAVAGILYGVLVGFLIIDAWFAHRARKRDWHEIQLKSWEIEGGREVTSTFTITQLVPTAPRDVVLTALSLHQALAAGDATISIASLSGARFLGAGANLIGVGEITPTAARNMLTNFATVGLIKGRSDGRPGEWVPASTDEVVQLVSKNWHKVRS